MRPPEARKASRGRWRDLCPAGTKPPLIAPPSCPSPRVPDSLTLADFDYVLPPELIAQSPAPERTGSRLLHVDRQGALHDESFTAIQHLLQPGDLLVFNDTRVIKARLHGHKLSGGKVEVLVERITAPDQALAHIRASKSPKPGSRLRLADAVYARAPGAVAAPTAGLHFDAALLAQLRALGVNLAFVTLHVGAGTFQPVRVQNLADHVMHAEWYTVPQATADAIQATRRDGGRVIAVGTTSVRALESAARANGVDALAGAADTRLFITPGYDYQVIDAMITNFHLPQSTLLMLVAAFIGQETMRRAYAHAIAARYRFFSYGDAMFLERSRPT